MKMKKLAAIIFSAAMVLNMGAAAMADGSATTSFKKSYKVTGGDGVTTPSETLGFEVTADLNNPGNEMITITDTPVTGNATISINVPEYAKVGKYNYTVKEKAGNTQGVTYSDTTFGVQILVTNDADGDGKLDTQLAFTTGDASNKVDEIVNEYGLGSLTVSKKVSGNLASSTQKFEIDVTFTKEEGKTVASDISYGGNQTIGTDEWENGSVTKTISIAANESVTFSNIPAGVTYTVTEKAKHTATDTNGSDSEKGYTVEYTNNSGEKSGNGAISAGDVDTVEVLNTKGTSVDTGINLDSMPYIMILALVAVCAVVMFVRKRFSANR